MTRASEFSKKVRAEAFLRCKGKCEQCDAALKVSEGEYDHIIPLALTGESTLANCQVLCRPCHRGVGAKTADDLQRISKAKRVWLKHNNLYPKASRPLKSRGFSKRTST